MKVTVEKLTDWDLVAECARNTVWKEPLKDGKMPSFKFRQDMVESEHSPLRALIFKVRMEGIPTSSSVHFVRHKFGVEHYVASNRPDRNGGNTAVDRNTPVNHVMIVNAQELLFMARRRLCKKAAPETREVMHLIKNAMMTVDYDVWSEMMPMCYYRRGCFEPDGCGYFDTGKERTHEELHEALDTEEVS